MAVRPPPKTKIFVGHLPEDCDAGELRVLFEKYGRVTECDILNRFGFVHMSTPEEAREAIRNLNNISFKGTRISVEQSTGKRSGFRSFCFGPSVGPSAGGPMRSPFPKPVSDIPFDGRAGGPVRPPFTRPIGGVAADGCAGGPVRALLPRPIGGILADGRAGGPMRTPFSRPLSDFPADGRAAANRIMPASAWGGRSAPYERRSDVPRSAGASVTQTRCPRSYDEHYRRPAAPGTRHDRQLAPDRSAPAGPVPASSSIVPVTNDSNAVVRDSVVREYYTRVQPSAVFPWSPSCSSSRSSGYPSQAGYPPSPNTSRNHGGSSPPRYERA